MQKQLRLLKHKLVLIVVFIYKNLDEFVNRMQFGSWEYLSLYQRTPLLSSLKGLKTYVGAKRFLINQN